MKIKAVETRTIDQCKCVYCGHLFTGADENGNQLDQELANIVKCPNCQNELVVYLSVEYLCLPRGEGAE